jgi:ubiquinone biosynthesis protein
MADSARGREFLVIPRVHAELSSATVLTLDYVEGTKVSEVTAESGFDLERVARNVIEAAFRQLFEDGLFHGDPHPGNILVLPGNRIALLDFGLVGRLSRAQQEALVTLIVAVALRDPDSAARVINRIGIPDAHTPIAEFREDIRHILDRYVGLKLDEIRTATLLRDLLDLAVRHRIRIPKEYAVLAKASITVEGIIRRLHPRLDVLEVGLPYAKELLLARFNPGDASSTLMRSLLKLQGLAEDVPAQLTQILVDLEGGKFRVNVHSDDLDRVGAHVRAIGVMLFLGMLAAGLTVGGLGVLSAGGRTWLGAGALGLAAALAAAAARYPVATLRMRKISLRRFLKRGPP